MFWYTDIQFFGHALDTRPEYELGTYRARGSDNSDVDRRVEVLEAVADAARERASASSYCLKIFVVPEFFFRGRRGAYELAQQQRVVQKVREFTNAPDWKHWIFFCGTTMLTYENEAGETEILNLVLVQQGHAGEEGARIVAKENLLEGDLLRESQRTYRTRRDALTFDAATGIKTAEQFLEQRNRGDGAELQKNPSDGRGVFDMQGVRFAVEVCADHLGARVARSPTAWLDYLPQIQVVPACGVMGLTQQGVVASRNGFAFLCDGFFTGGQQNGVGRTELVKVTQQKLGPTTLASFDNIDAAEYIPMEETVRAAMGKRWKNVFADAGELHIYPTQKIPWAARRWS